MDVKIKTENPMEEGCNFTLVKVKQERFSDQESVESDQDHEEEDEEEEEEEDEEEEEEEEEDDRKPKFNMYLDDKILPDPPSPVKVKIKMERRSSEERVPEVKIKQEEEEEEEEEDEEEDSMEFPGHPEDKSMEEQVHREEIVVSTLDQCCNPFNKENHHVGKYLRVVSESMLQRFPNLKEGDLLCPSCRSVISVKLKAYRRCCNPFELTFHRKNKLNLRPVMKWMTERIPSIKKGQYICDKCYLCLYTQANITEKCCNPFKRDGHIITSNLKKVTQEMIEVEPSLKKGDVICAKCRLKIYGIKDDRRRFCCNPFKKDHHNPHSRLKPVLGWMIEQNPSVKKGDWVCCDCYMELDEKCNTLDKCCNPFRKTEHVITCSLKVVTQDMVDFHPAINKGDLICSRCRIKYYSLKNMTRKCCDPFNQKEKHRKNSRVFLKPILRWMIQARPSLKEGDYICPDCATALYEKCILPAKCCNPLNKKSHVVVTNLKQVSRQLMNNFPFLKSDDLICKGCRFKLYRKRDNSLACSDPLNLKEKHPKPEASLKPILQWMENQNPSLKVGKHVCVSCLDEMKKSMKLKAFCCNPLKLQGHLVVSKLAGISRQIADNNPSLRVGDLVCASCRRILYENIKVSRKMAESMWEEKEKEKEKKKQQQQQQQQQQQMVLAEAKNENSGRPS